jgi:very-short-patch-repair endonuclease
MMRTAPIADRHPPFEGGPGGGEPGTTNYFSSTSLHPKQTMNGPFNDRREKDQRRQLRATMPPAETILWSRLRRRQLLGCKFRRQHSVGSYVLDFFSAEIKLGIELDGDSHFEPGAPEYDQERQGFIESFGI